jgi:hypothetical protein
MSAKLRYNPDHSAFEVTVGEQIWTDEMTDQDDFMVLPSESGNPYCVVLEDSQLQGVEPNMVYELVKVTTVKGVDEEFDLDDDGEGEA